MHRNTRLKPVPKPAKPVVKPVRTSQTCSQAGVPTSLTVHISRDLVRDIQDKVGRGEGQDRHKRSTRRDKMPPPKRPRGEGEGGGRGRGRVSSLSEEDWEEKELDEDIFKKV